MSNQHEQYVNQWITRLKTDNSSIDIELINHACQLLLSHGAKPTPFAHSALQQGIEMADILLTMNCNSNCIAAAICYPTFYYFNLTTDRITKNLNKSITHLLQGATRLEAINDIHSLKTKTISTKQIDNLRKMLLAMVDDINVVLIKLAERLTILTHIKNHDPEQQYLLADQTMHLYAPLANRLGIGQIKWQLEDLSFRYLQPDEYFNISKRLKLRRIEREEYIEQIKKTLNQLVQTAAIKTHQITGRAKHIYSIHKKAQRKNVDIGEIYDTNAFRILVPQVEDCYSVLSLVHAAWQPIKAEFDDYIANPKANGYQSIHTAVLGPGNFHIEIQIRTQAMHEAAELGLAAHWKYKEGAGESNYANKIDWLRQLLDWQQEVSNKEQQEVQQEIFNDRIYVFSPDGEVFDLPCKATPLDFAYHVHTQVGHRCKGAKVNGKLVTLTQALVTGDSIEIITSKQDNPSRDWLNSQLGYVTTPSAKNKIRHWFRQVDFQHHLTEGQSLWEKAARRLGYQKTDLSLVYAEFNFKQVDDLLAALGAGDIGIVAISQRLRALKLQEHKTDTQQQDHAIILKPQQTKQPKSNVLIEGESNVLTQFARCCKPIFGDTILGYITKGQGISIHKADCHNIKIAFQTRAERLINVSWGHTESNQPHPASICIIAADRSGLIRDITSTLAENKISLLELNTQISNKDHSAKIKLTITINDTESLKKIINKLLQINGVAAINRV